MNMANLEIVDLQWQAKIEIFAKTVVNIKISPGALDHERRRLVYFKIIPARYFGNIDFELFEVATTPS